MTKAFYRYTTGLDALKQKANPRADDLHTLLKIIGGDDELAIWFYEKNEFSPAPEAAWVPLLKDAGQFEELGDAAEKATVLWRVKAQYLAKSAAGQPEEVCQVITEIHPFDSLVQSHFLDALLNLPIDVAVRASSIVWDYLGGREQRVWSWVGDPVAKFMLKILESDPNLAFGIAGHLLAIWANQEEKISALSDIRSRFESYAYGDFVFKYFNAVWDKYPYRAVKLLVRTLGDYIEEVSREKGFDVSQHFYVSVENLDSIEQIDRGYESILISAICEAGEVVIAKEAGCVPELLALLRGAEKQIFQRIEMYLLRFLPSGMETARIEEIVTDPALFDSYGFRYEYALLVRDKAADISEAGRKAFLKLVKETKVDSVERFAEWFRETRGRDYTQDDLEKYENRRRAAKLYLVQPVFRELYEEYRMKGETTDEQLRPCRVVEPARWVSPTEGSPATVEDIAGRRPAEVFAYLGAPSNWDASKERTGPLFGPKQALGSVFQQVVKRGIRDYVTEEHAAQVAQLDSDFTASYFQGVWDAIRGGEWRTDFWGGVLAIAKAVVDAHKNNADYRDAFRAMLSALREAFGKSEKSMVFDAGAVETFWSILNPLVRYDEPPVTSEHERDPIQLRCSSVNGSALEQVVSLGIEWKNEHGKLFNDTLKAQIEGLFKYVIANVRRAEVLCTFGLDFPRLGWLDEEWLRSHTDAIFAEDMWDVVWGTYVSWGRPSPRAFALLYERGQYRKAVDAIGKSSPWGFTKEPEEGLSEHLMIALFNGWLDEDPKGLLLAFMEQAPAALRGHAAKFLTTGFEELKKEPDANVSKRLKQYWEQRLASMEKDHEANKEEAVQFLYWAKNSPFTPDETLGLLRKTLDITEGQMPADHFPTEFFRGISEAAQENELMALECLNRVMADPRMGTHISLIRQWIKALFDGILELSDEHAGVSEIRQEAMHLADAFGRMHVYDFRPVYQALDKKVGRN